MVTVKLCDALCPGGFVPETTPLREMYESLYIKDGDRPLTSCKTHPLIEAAVLAYNSHIQLSIRPDDVWLTIAQGISHHINMNSESLRKKLVSHKGKVRLKARGVNFEHALSAMVDQLSERCKNRAFVAIMLNTFSTSTPTTLLASQANLMGSVSKYFEYELKLQCGIPSVALEGTLQDWEEICRRVRVIKEMKIGLGWWADELAPVADALLQTYKGNVDIGFWGHILDEENLWGSDGTRSISGWLSKLFPYDRHGNRRGKQTESDMFPRGVTKMPFELEEAKQQLEIASGFLGIDASGEGVCPYIGWYIREHPVCHLEQLSKHAQIMDGKPGCCAIA